MGIELWVFGHRHHGQFAGFRGPNAWHPQDKNMLGWWPSMGVERLRGLVFQKVIITESFRYADNHPRWIAEIRARVRDPNAIWIEL